MKLVIYVRNDKDIPIYEQFNVCAEYCKRYGYSIAGKVLDFDGTQLHKAVNMVIADNATTALMIYSKDLIFPQYNDYLFYRIYLEKLGKQLITYK